MSFCLVNGDDNRWATYASWFERRKDLIPKRPKHGIFVAKGSVANLIAGVCLYPTEGDWIVVEHVATNPDASSEDRSAALDFMADALRIYGAIVGKMPVCFPTEDSIAQRLLAHGWQHTAATTLIAAPIYILPDVPQKETPPHAGGDGEAGSQRERTSAKKRVRRAEGPVKLSEIIPEIMPQVMEQIELTPDTRPDDDFFRELDASPPQLPGASSPVLPTDDLPLVGQTSDRA